MRVVALVSGGKDSCYNMMQCVAAGHDIVALANLCPDSKADELDSYMYQTVGHHGIDMYAEAVDLPLFRRITQGVAVHQGCIYTPTLEDEVEDLYHLLKQVKDEVNVDAVAVGAILSDYQRVRVENVCHRLGLVALSYLWRRDQTELLQEMIDCKVEAILIKVAALGLDPTLHLGKTVKQMQPHLLLMKEKYGLNVCGEGGEYETFTLDCPLFKKSIVIDEWETVIHSDDGIAPVGYLSFKSFHLVEKEDVSNLSLSERLNRIPVRSPLDFLSDLDEPLQQPSIGDDEDDLDDVEAAEVLIGSYPSLFNDIGPEVGRSMAEAEDDDDSDTSVQRPSSVTEITSFTVRTISQVFEYWRWCGPIPDSTCTLTNQAGWCWIGGILGQGENCVEAIKSALSSLLNLLKREHLSPMDIVAVSLYIRDMDMFADINSVYRDFFRDHSEWEIAECIDENDSLPKNLYVPPPVRICVEIPLPQDTPILLDALAFREDSGKKSPDEAEVSDSDGDDASSSCSIPGIIRQAMHVQGISHWAPANIGPYSQAVRIGDIIYVCGQIALIPGSMEMIEGGIKYQCKLALRHIGRIIKAMDPKTQLRDVVQGICYVVHPLFIPKAREEWEKRTNNAIVDYVVVRRLPRNAYVEWHIWAHRHNSTFDYEETGCHIHGDVKVSIRRRWNYESTVAAIVCYLSTAASLSETEKVDTPAVKDEVYEESGEDLESRTNSSDPLDEDNLVEALSYMLKKLLQGAPSPFTFVSNLRIFYKVGGSLSPAQLQRIVTKCGHATGYLVVHSLIPVCQLHNESTFLSICGVRHE